MSTTIDETKVREINELLALETYQGMSDEEIQSIIDYRVQVGVNEFAKSYETQRGIIVMNELLEGQRQRYERTASMLESILTEVRASGEVS